ncbi:MAG: TIGR01212 family radical SAM protein [Deltaproteobacteria bacterium]|nr:MAG: TIGR01212 family radical SAM protein [Deltaproteobacteria bacterium]
MEILLKPSYNLTLNAFAHILKTRAIDTFIEREHVFVKRYRDFNSYLREMIGERVQKISLDAGLNCPNRDGTISDEGCIYCDSQGSGTGALINRGLSIDEQITESRKYMEKRYGAKKFIAYFQSFTNTYAPVPQLKELYDQALNHPDMVGLSVATRPDCVNKDILTLLSSYRERHLVWVEYGLQSAHDITLSRINRGHDVACFERSVRMAKDCGLNVCAHIILGLPEETREMMLQTALFLAELPIDGVKIHLLYIVKGTPLAVLYEKGEYSCLERDEYVELVVDVLELLPPDMVIQRLTGDPIGVELVAPLWAKHKSENLKRIRERLEEKDTWQGRLYQKSTAGK